MVIQICLNTTIKGTNGYRLPFHAPDEDEEGNRKQFLAWWLLKRFTYGAVAAVISKRTVLKVVPGQLPFTPIRLWQEFLYDNDKDHSSSQDYLYNNIKLRQQHFKPILARLHDYMEKCSLLKSLALCKASLVFQNEAVTISKHCILSFGFLG